MEAFSLLKYWRSNAGVTTTNPDVTTSTTTTDIVNTFSTQTSETENEEEDDENDNDHGPFFDLEFTLPPEEHKGAENDLVKNAETENSIGCEEDEEDSDGSDESELKFTLLSDSSGDITADVDVSLSPSDDLFFKGGFLSVDQTTEVNSKSRVSLIKSATKFQIMMLKFKKLKSSEITELDTPDSSVSKGSEEDAPIVSLFKRHNSSKVTKKRQNDVESVSGSSSEEKKFSKEAMQRYLRKVKPLYVRVSKRYGEKLKFTGQLNSLSLPRVTKPNLTPLPSPSPSVTVTEEPKQSLVENLKTENDTTSEVSEPPLLLSNVKALKQGNLPAGLRVVCKHLWKSRSGFTAVTPGAKSSNRRDDSLLQQQDGIQSAILHCKRSFKASRDSDCSSSKCENSSSSSDVTDDKETEEISKR